MADDSKNSRTYHILKKRDLLRDGDGKSEVFDYGGTVDASSAEQAIRLVAAEQPSDGAGTYVAVPDRSWTLIGVRVETPAPRIILDNGDQPEPIPGQTTLA